MKLVADLHTHTIASDHAYSTVLENTRVAADRGLEMIALTDHGPTLDPGTNNKHFLRSHTRVPCQPWTQAGIGPAAFGLKRARQKETRRC